MFHITKYDDFYHKNTHLMIGTVIFAFYDNRFYTLKRFLFVCFFNINMCILYRHLPVVIITANKSTMTYHHSRLGWLHSKTTFSFKFLFTIAQQFKNMAAVDLVAIVIHL